MTETGAQHMSYRVVLGSWKYPVLLLFGVGVSNVGDWIYLISLNLIVLRITGSPLAVAALYGLKPLSTLFTNVWAGSVIDRVNKRKLMVFLDLFRALFVAALPFSPSLWMMYPIVFVINMASSMFAPTSMTYITKLIPPEQRKRFNSLRGLIESGGFLIGPAVAGMLFFVGTPTLAIYINAISFFLSGLLTLFMPNLEQQSSASKSKNNRLSLGLLSKDWRVVLDFSRRYFYVMIIYFLFSCMMVMASAVDSIEAPFAKKVLFLSDSAYGFLVSLAGAGIAIGAFVNTIFAKKLGTSFLISFGSIFVSVGYIIYAFSNSLLVAAIGFFVLSFSLAFANTGFLTFYQKNIPVDVMGRVASAYGFIQAVLIILTTVILGVASQLVSIQLVVIVGTLFMFLITLTLCIFSFQPSKSEFYETSMTD
jgi:MFS family permease